MSRCKTCAYRSADHNGGVEGCAYIQITGKSRLKDAYMRLGVNHITDEVREALRPANCRQYERGSRKGIDEKHIVLDGSLPRKREAPSVAAAHGGENAKKERTPRPCKWDKAAAMELWEQGLTDPEIAQRLGVATETIRHWRKDMNLMPNYRAIGMTAKLLPLWHQGLSDKAIAKATGLSLMYVQRWRNKRRLKRYPEPEELQKAAEMAKRRALYDAGKTDREISEELGIKLQTVVTWRWQHRLPANKGGGDHAL